MDANNNNMNDKFNFDLVKSFKDISIFVNVPGGKTLYVYIHPKWSLTHFNWTLLIENNFKLSSSGVCSFNSNQLS